MERQKSPDPIRIPEEILELSAVPAGLELLNDRVLDGGKRMRPELLFRVAECLGLDRRTVLPYAVAAERIHNATLLHDDVIDEAKQRRGRPTLNANGENRRAILAGDLLMARTFRDLGESEHTPVLRDLFAVLVDLTEGEWLQLEARGVLDVSERHLRAVARKKTASLLSWCFSTPARVALQPQRVIDALRSVGMHLGVAFQLWDDAEDFNPASGKGFAQDLREGQVNSVVRDLLANDSRFREVIARSLGVGLPEPLPGDLESAIHASRQRILVAAGVEVAAAEVGLEDSGLEQLQVEALRERVLRPYSAWVLGKGRGGEG